jgi:hypothetical protein
LGNTQHLVLEIVHAWGITDKGDYHQTGRDDPITLHTVKFIRLVEDYLPLLQLIPLPVGSNKYHTLIHIQQLPEVMPLTFEDKLVGILKIMKGHKMTHI